MKSDRSKSESIWRRRGIRDAVAVVALCVLTYAAAARFEIFDRLYAFVKLYDTYDLDELIVVAFAFGFLMVLYTLRRGQDFKLEIAKREEAEKKTNDHASQLATAVNNIPQGIVMHDSSERLVVCNNFYLKMYDLPADIVKPGITLREVFEQRIKAGHLTGSAEYYRAELLALVAKKVVSHRVVETADGREIAITDFPLADGSWVGIHEDRTEARRRESSFKLLFDNNPLVMWLIDRDTLRFVAVNDAAIACYGYSREQFMAMRIIDLRPENKAEAEAYVRGLPEIQNEQRPGRHLRADGTIIQVRISSRILNYEGREVRLAAVTDVTARKAAEDELRRTKIFLDTVIETVPMPIVVKTVKDGRFTLINKASAELHGYDRDATIGKTLYDIFPRDRADMITAQDAECLGADHPTVIRDHMIPTPHGERLITTKKIVIPGDGGKPEYLLTLIDDVTEQRATEARIAHMAHSDPLTDLPNRAAFNERLSATLELAEKENRSFAVLCIDLDGFKGINDIYGHAVGDLLLCQIADRLRVVAGEIFVSRLGGDEFTIIAAIEEENSVSDLTHRLTAAFVDDFDVDGHRLPQALSIGISVYPKDGTDAKTLMNNADAALYRAKADGSGSVRYFEAEMAAQLRERIELQTDLRDAVQKDELRVHYQPQFSIKGEIQGFEALTRWSSATRGMVPPGDFIPLAEESSLILVLGEWVLRQACCEAASWDKPLSIAVNISPIQFRHGDLPGLVHSILLETGLPASRLELEITEGVLIDDFSRALSVLLRLKAIGVRIALDDFGKGYSSLSYLRAFTFDKIKIDRSFISELATNHQSVVIVRTVIGLGRSLNIPVLAEGVETQAQHDVLAHEGCDQVQGYLTGRPLPIEEYADVVGRKLVTRERAQAS